MGISETNAKRWAVFFCLLSISIMGLIFFFSSQPADESKDLSDGFLAFLLQGNIPFFSWFFRETAFFERVPLRKCAHATVYFLLGFSNAGAVFMTGRAKQKEEGAAHAVKRRIFPGFLLPWLLSVCYSCTDEWHQTFVEGRSGEIRDVLIDSGGAFVGVLVFLFVMSCLAREEFGGQKACQGGE